MFLQENEEEKFLWIKETIEEYVISDKYFNQIVKIIW